jgi:hypothetical protein
MARHSEEGVAARRQARLEAKKAAREAEANQDPNDPEVEDEEPIDYSTWTNDDLRAELAGRNLSADGKKVDLLARLKADDEAAEKE